MRAPVQVRAASLRIQLLDNTSGKAAENDPNPWSPVHLGRQSFRASAWLTLMLRSLGSEALDSTFLCLSLSLAFKYQNT